MHYNQRNKDEAIIMNIKKRLFGDWVWRDNWGSAARRVEDRCYQWAEQKIWF